MKRLGLLLMPGLMVGCGFTLRANVPPPPTVTVTAEATTPPAPPDAPAATADVSVDAEPAEPVQEGEPEEVAATSEPPDPPYEEQTEAPDPNYVWVGGYWGWNGADWGWNWGRWESPPEGRVYIEPYYERVGGSVVYVHGYWGAHDAPRRSYGGERIRFAAAARPANYRRGEHVVIEHRAGPPPGKRPGGSYEHASGTPRPVPHDTVPHRAIAAREAAKQNTTARGPANAHETPVGHDATKHGATTGHETAAGHEPMTGHESATTAHETARGHETTNRQEAAAGHETAGHEAAAGHTTPHETTNRNEAAPGHGMPQQGGAMSTSHNPAAHSAPSGGPPKKKK